jgi:hypothetical protein
MALEGFSEEDATEILDCDITTLRHLVDEAGRELAAEIATDVLIIEDEALIAIDLETLVESLGHQVIGVARTHAEAVNLTRAKQPGLILEPFQQSMLSATLSQALFFGRTAKHSRHSPSA